MNIKAAIRERLGSDVDLKRQFIQLVGEDVYAAAYDAGDETQHSETVRNVFGSDTRAPQKRGDFSRQQKAEFFAAMRAEGKNPSDEWYKIPE